MTRAESSFLTMLQIVDVGFIVIRAASSTTSSCTPFASEQILVVVLMIGPQNHTEIRPSHLNYSIARVTQVLAQTMILASVPLQVEVSKLVKSTLQLDEPIIYKED